MKTELRITARRTEPLDVAGILKLVREETYDLFGRVNVVTLIEKANLGVTLVDECDTIVGHASFYSHPNNVPQNTTWTEWLHPTFPETQQCDPINSLFLNFFVGNESFSEGVTNEILRVVFHAVPLLHFVILIIPKRASKYMKDIGLSKVFTPVKTQNADYDVMLSHRHIYYSVLHMRDARVEDHDDLMPIFAEQSCYLQHLYGEYFLSELIEAQDSNNKCIVADVDGTAVGFLSVTTTLNTDILKDNFELDVFNSFCKKIIKKEEIIVESATTQNSLNPDERRTPEKGRRSGVRGVRSKLSNKHLQESPSNIEVKETRKEEVTKIIDMESVCCIQLFCINEQYESRSIDFLLAVFELFPDKEYIILTTPHNVPHFPLLHQFQRIPPRPSSTFPQELYIFNRNGLLRGFKVRSCTSLDMQKIASLVDNIQGRDKIMSDLKNYYEYRRNEDDLHLFIYVAEVMEQLVGVCVFSQEKETEYLRSNYNIEDFIYFRLYETEEHAHLHHFVLNPIFQHYSKYFLREVMVMAGKSSLYHLMYPQLSKEASLPTCLNDLVPVSHRRQIEYPLENLDENAPSKDVIKDQEPFALMHINRKLTHEPKVVINVRIVVVGGSDVGISLLQSLVYCPHLRFNNLTLVSNNDLAFNPDASPNEFLPQNLEYNKRTQALMSLKTWTNFINGTMTEIDRERKLIMVDGEYEVPYDQLILCTGTQFHYAVPTGVDIKKLYTTSEATRNMKQVHIGEVPYGVFALNNRHDEMRIKECLQNTMAEDKIIVYGSTLEAYTCMQALLEHGVSGSNIIQVIPPTSDLPPFHDPYVDDVIKRVLVKNGVKLYPGYTLADWNDGGHSCELKFATFTSDTKPITLECKMFLCCHEKTVDFNAFKAMNDSYLVFDGRLVIDPSFRTNDPVVRAAGPLTKYARSYYSDQFTHARYNSKEIGERLAEKVLEMFDPTFQTVNDEIIHYQQPIVVNSTLPGGYNYLQVYKPGSLKPVEANCYNSGEDFVTGDASTETVQKYFNIHVDQYNTVESITCLSSQPMAISNLRCIYGLHARYLNDLAQRYKDGSISDFYSYFRQPWVLLVYHDRFPTFRKEIAEIFNTPSESGMNSLREKVELLLNDNQRLSEEGVEHLTDAFVGGGAKQCIEERLMSYLEYNKHHLPMYARPTLL